MGWGTQGGQVRCMATETGPGKGRAVQESVLYSLPRSQVGPWGAPGKVDGLCLSAASFSSWLLVEKLHQKQMQDAQRLVFTRPGKDSAPMGESHAPAAFAAPPIR